MESEQLQSEVAAKKGPSFDVQKIAESIILVLIGFGISAIVIQAAGYSASNALATLVQSSIGTPSGLSSTLWEATSLTMTGLAATIAFRAGLFNIGVEGQAYIGGFMGFLIGYYLSLPPALEIPLVIIASALGGILWALIPAFLKAYRDVNEVVTTIMMNYIGSYLVSYLQTMYKSPYGNAAYTSQVNPSAQFTRLFGWGTLDTGIIVSLLGLAVVYFILWYTTIGYSIRVSGFNPYAARYAGVNPKRMTMFVMLLSGALAGIGGALFTNSSIIGHFDITTITGVGLNGITVSLVGQIHPLGTLLGALLVGAMVASTPFIEIATGMPPQLVQLITGIIVVAAAIPGIITMFRVALKRWRRQKPGEGKGE
ncbi:MAG: ABC transporter permease [Conexivisphaerales archaeon]